TRRRGRARVATCSMPALSRFSSFDRLTSFGSASNSRTAIVLLLPAIDLRGGRCVRLRQGDYDQETVFGDDPPAVARRWAAAGATYLHLVDLDGAKHGQPINGD